MTTLEIIVWIIVVGLAAACFWGLIEVLIQDYRETHQKDAEWLK